MIFPRETKRFSEQMKTEPRKENGMFRRILAAVLACAVFGTVSPLSRAESVSTAEESAQETEYIYSDISEKQVYGNALYEEILAKQIVFYSNIPNGAVIDYAVVLDLPETISVAMEKDGEKTEYNPGETIEAPGKYSLTMTVGGDELLGGKENEVYYGLFRFWIIDIPPDSYPEYSSDESQYTDNDYTESVENSENADIDEVPDDGESADSDESVPADTVSGEAAADSTEDGGDGSDSADSGDESQSDTNDSAGFVLPKNDSAVKLTQYAESDGIRAVTDNGTEFFCSVPAGTAAVGPVTLDVSQDAEYRLLKNDEEQADFDFGSPVTEKGEYSLLVTDGDDGEPAEFRFSITGENVSGLTEYTVPDGCVIVNAALGKSGIRSNGNSVDLGSEGEYSIEISCGAYKFTEKFTLDNTPPEFAVNGLDENGKSIGGTVMIELISEDVDGYTVFLNGKSVQSGLSLSEPGKYTVVVYDKAGNSSAQDFEIIYQMNGMAVVSIILAGALVAAGAVFFILTRKKFSIR